MRLLVSGTTKSLRRLLPQCSESLGYLKTPAAGNKIETILSFGLPWAIDNGAFSGFDPVVFRALLGRVQGQPSLLWVTCPDRVADAQTTLQLFEQWDRELHGQGFPVAFVGQDGQELLSVPWSRFEAFFIGGSTRWKLSEVAADLAQEAKRRGKMVHMGRVNSRKRLEYAYLIGCDSVDGTGMSRWGDRHLAKFVRWLVTMKHGLYQPDAEFLE